MSADSGGGWRWYAAWSVHALTASGAVCCLMALTAAADFRWKTMFVWLGAAVVIDGIDGALARGVGVKRILPHFDGTLLDSIVDYAGYVLVPAFALGRSSLLPNLTAWPVAALVCLASAYQFCQADAKTEDHFFKGFPSYWNIVLFYLFVGQWGPMVNLAVVLVLILLVFVPFKYVYPSRTATMRSTTIFLTSCWAVGIAMMLWKFPDVPRALLYGSLIYVAYYVGLSALLNGPHRPATPERS